MYQIMIDNGINPPIVTRPELNEVEALWWADRLRELQSASAVNIVHTVEVWLTERLPETVGPRTERPGANVGAEV